MPSCPDHAHTQRLLPTLAPWRGDEEHAGAVGQGDLEEDLTRVVHRRAAPHEWEAGAAQSGRTKTCDGANAGDLGPGARDERQRPFRPEVQAGVLLAVVIGVGVE